MSKKQGPGIDWENQDWIGKALEPKLQTLATRIPESLSPNQITLSAFFIRMLAALLIFVAFNPAVYLIAGLLLLIGELLDSLDGIHARIKNKCTPYGRFLDLSLDTIAVGIVLLVLLIRFELLQPIFVISMMMRLMIVSLYFGKAISIGKLKLPFIGSCTEVIGLALAISVAAVIELLPTIPAWVVPDTKWSLSSAFPIQVFLLVNLITNVLAAASMLFAHRDFAES